MTKKLEEIFDLPPPNHDEDITADAEDHPSEANLPVLPEALAALDKIESALPAVRGLEASDAEMDELADKAKREFDNLMDLGMNVDSRYASEIFAVASQMLGHAITAKNAKLNKKLKMIELQLKKARLDQDNPNDNVMPTAQGHVLDRNELLRHLTQRDQPKTSSS
jgi:vancomycin resistance protein YoaR